MLRFHLGAFAGGVILGCLGLATALAQAPPPTQPQELEPVASRAAAAPKEVVRAVVRRLSLAPPSGLANFLTTQNHAKPYAVVGTDLIKSAIAEDLATREGMVHRIGNVLTLNEAAVPAQVDVLTAEEIRRILVRKFSTLTGLKPPSRDVLNDHISRENQLANDVVRRRPSTLQAGTFLKAPTPDAPVFNWTQLGYVFSDKGVVSSPQNQGGCGCCWAFATIGAYEAAYAIKHRVMIGASEQYLLNCAAAVGLPDPPGQPWSCDGGWWAFDMFWEEKLNHAGVPPRLTLPYSGMSQPCTPMTDASRPYKVANWGYVGSSADIPADADLKKALCEHGPLVVAVYADVAWMGNQGDVIDDFPNNPDRGVDHAIVLVGWDDSRGAWIIKNSWGTGCGIPVGGQTTGFMYIKYGSNNIGYSAAWVEAE